MPVFAPSLWTPCQQPVWELIKLRSEYASNWHGITDATALLHAPFNQVTEFNVGSFQGRRLMLHLSSVLSHISFIWQHLTKRFLELWRKLPNRHRPVAWWVPLVTKLSSWVCVNVSWTTESDLSVCRDMMDVSQTSLLHWALLWHSADRWLNGSSGGRRSTQFSQLRAWVST